MNKQDVRHHLTGPVMSMQTPFDSDGNVDYDGVRAVIDASLAGGSRTIMLTAGDSHYDCLGDEEIAELTRVTCRHTAGRGMVIVADRYHATTRAIAFAEFAKEARADVVMCLPPDWGHSCVPVSLAEHYAAVGKVMPVMIVTNRFSQRGAQFGLEAIDRALDLSDNIVAIKDDMCGTFAHDLCLLAHERCAIIAGGMKRNHMNMWPYGGTGYLSAFVTYNPAVSSAYWRAVEATDIPAAVKIIREKENPWLEHLKATPGGLDAAIHGMLELLGLAKRYRRRPYHTISDEQLQKLADGLRELELL